MRCNPEPDLIKHHPCSRRPGAALRLPACQRKRGFLRGLTAFLAAALLLSGCAEAEPAPDAAGKIYHYEKEGFGGIFALRIETDGTFGYYEGGLSSYIGDGEWEQDGDTLTLREELADHTFVRHFAVEEDALRFLAEGSDNFIYVKVADGERFFAVAAIEEDGSSSPIEPEPDEGTPEPEKPQQTSLAA